MIIFEKAKLLATKFNGECLSEKFSICKGRSSIKFKCLNNHTFFLPLENLEELQLDENRITEKCLPWCYKCKKFYKTCSDVAS